MRATVRGGALRFSSEGPAAPHPRAAHVGCERVLRDTDIGEILVQPDDLQRRVRELGAEISKDYADRDLLLIGVLKGAVFFLADLMREIEAPCEVDSWPSPPTARPRVLGRRAHLKDLDTPIEGRDVLIVEDIVDSGLTLQYLLRTLEARGPASLEVCALLTKPERRTWSSPRATSASRSRTSSRSATGSTTRSDSATCGTRQRYLSHRRRGQTAPAQGLLRRRREGP